MRSRAAYVPLAAATATIVLFATAAWGQTPDESSPPEPTATETPSPEPSVDETQPPVVETEQPEPEPSPARSEDPSDKDDGTKPGSGAARSGDRPNGSIEVAAQPQSIQLFAAPKAVRVGKKVYVWGRLGPDGGGR